MCLDNNVIGYFHFIIIKKNKKIEISSKVFEFDSDIVSVTVTKQTTNKQQTNL